MKRDDRKLAEMVAAGVALLPKDEILYGIEATNNADSYPIHPWTLKRRLSLGLMDVNLETVVEVDGEWVIRTYQVLYGPAIGLIAVRPL